MTAGPEAAAGARDLVGDVQRFGLFSAATVVDRYVALVDRAITRDPVAPPPADGRRPRRRRRPGWRRPGSGCSTPPRHWLGDGAPRDPATGTLVLPPARPGQRSEASLWVHNTTSSPAPAVELHATASCPPTGRSIPADAVSLVPDRVDLLPARASPARSGCGCACRPASPPVATRAWW